MVGSPSSSGIGIEDCGVTGVTGDTEEGKEEEEEEKRRHEEDEIVCLLVA